MEYNFTEVGKRIKKLRKERGWTQDDLVEKLYISRNTLSAIENGKKEKFTLDILLSCCNLFGCDMGFLLGEFDKCQTLDAQFIHEYTGLSEESIQTLHFSNTWRVSDDASVIDKLLSDSRYHNEDKKSNRRYRSILSLLNYFFGYHNTTMQKQIYIDGRILDKPNGNFISANSILLNDIVIENAVLAEIQQALTSLKINLAEEEE